MIQNKTRFEQSSQEVQLSVIVPTFMERGNISELIQRAEYALNPLKFEMIIVDDSSPDGTAEYAEDLNKIYGNIKVVKRCSKLGLSSAVLDGFKKADAKVLAIMDADLQHPPELLPRMYKMIDCGCDFVVASRYVDGGRIKDWSLSRRILSKVALTLAHILLPKTRKVKDVLSGFFMLKREAIEDAMLNPVGYKILLELVVRGRYNSIEEVPFTFRVRKRGKSNLDLREIWNFLVHIFRLL